MSDSRIIIDHHSLSFKCSSLFYMYRPIQDDNTIIEHLVYAWLEYAIYYSEHFGPKIISDSLSSSTDWNSKYLTDVVTNTDVEQLDRYKKDRGFWDIIKTLISGKGITDGINYKNLINFANCFRCGITKICVESDIKVYNYKRSKVNLYLLYKDQKYSVLYPYSYSYHQIPGSLDNIEYENKDSICICDLSKQWCSCQKLLDKVLDNERQEEKRKRLNQKSKTNEESKSGMNVSNQMMSSNQPKTSIFKQEKCQVPSCYSRERLYKHSCKCLLCKSCTDYTFNLKKCRKCDKKLENRFFSSQIHSDVIDKFDKDNKGDRKVDCKECKKNRIASTISEFYSCMHTICIKCAAVHVRECCSFGHLFK